MSPLEGISITSHSYYIYLSKLHQVRRLQMPLEMFFDSLQSFQVESEQGQFIQIDLSGMKKLLFNCLKLKSKGLHICIVHPISCLL